MGKGNRKVITSVVAFLIISMSMTLFLFRTNVEAAILGSKYYYLALEKDNLKKIKDKLKDNYIKNNLVDFSYEGKANAELVGDVFYAEPEIKSLADYISKFELAFKYNGSSKNLNDIYYTSLISAAYDGKKLADIDIKSADNKTQIAFPDLTDKSLGIESSSNSSKFIKAYLGDDIAYEQIFGITREASNKLIEKYVKDIIFKEIPDENVVFDSKANFENIECNSITFNIDQDIIANIYKAVAKELATDKEVRILCTSITAAFLDLSNNKELLSEMPTAEEIDTQILEMCEELNFQAEMIDDIQFTYTAYFENDGDILSRQYKDKLSDSGVNLLTYKDLSGMDIFKLNVEDNKQKIFELSNEAKVQNGSTYNGKLNIDVAGKSLVEANYTYEKEAKVGNLSAFIGEIEGKINIAQFGDSGLDNYVDSELSDIYFSHVSKRNDFDTYISKTKVTSKVDGKRMGINLYTEVNQSNVANITKPKVDLEKAVKLTDSSGIYEMGTDLGKNFMSKLAEIFPELKSNFNDGLYDEYYDEDYGDEYDY